MQKVECNKGMKYEDCELKILRSAVDEAEKKMSIKKVNNPEVKEIINVVEQFLRDNKLMCYGGTAINNILPLEAQFYDKSLEIPDYDFYSTNALSDCKKLANIYHKKGWKEIEGKTSSAHPGTYKLYVNFLPVADISQMDSSLFNNIYKESIKKKGIKYVPVNFLRMGMYLELSRPAGDVARWEKVLKRLILLNKYFPLKADSCMKVQTQRLYQHGTEDFKKKLYYTVRDAFIERGLVFFGGYANMLYSKYMPKNYSKKLKEVPDFDVLSTEPESDAQFVIKKLEGQGIENIEIRKHPGIGEIIADHYGIFVEGEAVAFIYEPLACHNYNTLSINKKSVKIATIDTMLSLYLAFYYADRPYYDKDRILCMSKFLFEVQQKNRLKQEGLLSRFSITCFGIQETIDDVRTERSKKYKEFSKKNRKDNFKDPEYLKYFFKYRPGKKSRIDRGGKNKTKKLK